MGLFYTTPADLKETEDFVMMVSQEIAIRGKGYGTAGLLEEYMPEAVRMLRACRDRLRAEGRDKDLKDFGKHLLRVGKYMDNGPYNHGFYPLIKNNLS